MNSINYKNLPSYLGTSNFILNIVDLNNTITNSSGLSATSALELAVGNIQKMVDFNKKQININAISNYDTTPIQVLAPLNLSNVNLYQNGNLFVGNSGGGSTSGSLSSGTTNFIISNTSNTSDIAFNFLAANSTILTLNQQGTLSIPYGASSNKFLECVDNSGTSQWNYVSNLTNNFASLNVLGNNNFSFQENSVEIASLNSNGNMTAQNFFSVSDKRFKTNISTITNAGELLKQIRGVRFDWLKDGSHDIGVIAQEVFDVIPEAVVSTTNVCGTNNNMLTVAYNKIIPVLIETINDLQRRIEVLEGSKS